MREGTLKQLNVKVGDKVRVIRSVNGSPINGNLITLTLVDHDHKYYRANRAGSVEDWKISAVDATFRLEEEAVEIKVGDEVEVFNDFTSKWEEGYTVLAIQDKDQDNPQRRWYVVAFKSDIPQSIKFKNVRKAKPKPVVEEVVMWGGMLETKPLKANFCSADFPGDTHKITFNLVDGEPDCNSIKMVKL